MTAGAIALLVEGRGTMPRGTHAKTREEIAGTSSLLVPEGDWQAIIFYIDHLGGRQIAVRPFKNRPDCEFAIREYLVHGITLVGLGPLVVVPAHMIQGITFQQIGAPDAKPGS